MTTTTTERPRGDAETILKGELVSMIVAGQLVGIPVDTVQDILGAQRITPVPMAAREVAGVLNLRGRIVTAIDMRRKLGLPDREDGAVPMAVGIEFKGESYGLIIDQVGEVMRLQPSSVEATPANLDSRWGEIANGVCRLEGQLMVLLDVEKVLAMSTETMAA